MKPVPKLSFLIICSSALVSVIILLGLTWLVGWGMGVYTVRWTTDLLFVFSLCYTLMGLTVWVGRGLRNYMDTNGFKAQVYASDNDRLDLTPRQRAWWLLIHENQIFIGWVVVGLLFILLAYIIGVVMKGQISPDTILRFMVRKDLLRDIPPELLR